MGELCGRKVTAGNGIPPTFVLNGVFPKQPERTSTPTTLVDICYLTLDHPMDINVPPKLKIDCKDPTFVPIRSYIRRKDVTGEVWA